jgi:hypothetical protein
LGLAGALASQMAAMIVTCSPLREPSWLGVVPLCLTISDNGSYFRLYLMCPMVMQMAAMGVVSSSM